MAKNQDNTVDPWERLGIRPVGIGAVPNLLDIAWNMEPKMTVCLVGETGIGKTPIVKQWAARNGGQTKILNFGHMTQEEISMIMFSPQGDSFGFVPPDWMLELNKKAEEDGCAVLFLDEWNRGDKNLVAALFTLTDERRIHDFKLSDNVLVVAAMNPSDGSYLVNEAEKDHAIRKRLNFIYAVHDLKAFLEYTRKSAWHPLVPDFIKASTTFLYDTGARDAGKCFPCPSNWEKVSRILEAAEASGTSLTSSAVRTMVEGQIGSVAASKFLDFVADQNTLIKPSEVLYEYTKNSKVRKKVSSLLGMKIDKKTGSLVENPKSKGSRHGSIHELNESVAMELFSDMPDAETVAPHLAQYIADLPNDLLSSFAAENLKREADRNTNGGQYLNKLSTKLEKHPEYMNKIGVIMKSFQDYRKSAGLIKDEDPAT